MRNWKDWTKKAGIRAIKTVAQAAIAGIGTAAFMGAVDWKYVLSASVRHSPLLPSTVCAARG